MAQHSPAEGTVRHCGLTIDLFSVTWSSHLESTPPCTYPRRPNMGNLWRSRLKGSQCANLQPFFSSLLALMSVVNGQSNSHPLRDDRWLRAGVGSGVLLHRAGDGA